MAERGLTIDDLRETLRKSESRTRYQ